jgi:hypothetical protein
MGGQAFDLLHHLAPREPFQGLDDAGVQCPPSLLKEAGIGHLVGEGMLESVLTFRKELCLVEKLSPLEVCEAAVHGVFGYLGNGLQQRQGHLRANDRCSLQELFLLRRQSVDACREHRLHRGRHLNTWERLGQTIRAPFPDQHLRFYQGAHALLQKEGIALRARDQQLGERCQARLVSEQGLQQFVGARWR